jgi:hypothetical protein
VAGQTDIQAAVSGDKKSAHLKRLESAAQRLRIFKADLLDYDVMAAAVVGCQEVFHVATPVPSEKLTDPEVSSVLGSDILFRTSIFLKNKLLLVSSIVAVEINPKGWPEGKIRDESCWSDEEFSRNNNVLLVLQVPVSLSRTDKL